MADVDKERLNETVVVWVIVVDNVDEAEDSETDKLFDNVRITVVVFETELVPLTVAEDDVLLLPEAVEDNEYVVESESVDV